MAINFPSSPNDGDIYSAVGRTWQYNATAGAWESLAEGNVSLSSLGVANHDQLTVNATGEFGNSLIPDTDVTYDLGSTTKKWRDLYLSGNSIQLGTKTITQDNIPEVDLSIAPEVLEIQVAAPAAGQNTAWLWTWLTSSLPYARRQITNSPEVSVPLYKQGTYTINNYAAYDLFGDMTQTHSLYLKWIDGAGTDNLVSWANSTGPVSDSHPDINGGNPTDVQRLNLIVPATVTPPTLTAPNVSYTVTNNGVGAYTFSGSASGDNPNIGPLYRGGTYTFNVNASGHPFYLTTDNGTNFSSGTYFGEYTNGVTGSRTDVGTVTIVVPVDAPDTLYYQCGNHGAMRGAITVKNLAVETNINGNYVLYFQHTQEGHKTPVEIRPIPSLVNQMCLVYDASVGKFVPQDLATYVENTPSFENKIREVAGTAELVVEDGSTVIAKVNVYDDSTYLPLVGNNPGDQAFATDTNILYIWDGSAWQQAGTNNTDDLTEGSTNLFYTDSRVSTYLNNNGYDTATNIVATITASAPVTLDTLNELAAALGDDPNFATTVTNQIAAKLSTADFDSTFDTRLATKTTTDVAEGTNLYHTTARVQSTAINNGSLRGSVNNATVQYGTSYSGTPLQGSFFFDSLNQKLKVYTGSTFVDAVPAGTGGGTGSETNANTTFEKYTYTITSTTNAVTGADDNANTLAYVTDGTENVEVFLNGIKQVEGASNDYVASTGTSVTFTYNLTSGDVVEVQVYALLTNDAYYLKSEVYTKAETNTQISTGIAGLVDTAPTTLDTLNELAAALGDDPNFATTVTNSIADKLSLSGGTLTGEVTNTNTFKALSTSSGDYVRMYGGTGTGKWDIYGNGANLRFSDNESAGAVVIDTNVGIGTTIPESSLHIGNASNNFEFATVNGSASYYSGIKLARGNGDWSALGHNNYMMLVTDNGWEVAKTTSKGNNATGRTTYLKVDDDEINVEKQFGFVGLSADPTATRAGQVYWNTSDNILRVYDGTQWGNISEPFDPTTNNAYVRLGFNNSGANSGTTTTQTTVSPSGSYSYTTNSKIGSHAIDFGTASTGYVDIQTQSTSTTFSMGGWFYITRANPAGRTYIVDFRTSDSNAGYWLFDNLGSMTVKRHDAEETWSHTVPTNQWVHWVLTSNGSSNFKFYQNGSLIRTGSTYSDNLSTTVTLATYFGARGGSGNYFLQGRVDNFFLALSEYNATEVSQIYNSQTDY